MRNAQGKTYILNFGDKVREKHILTSTYDTSPGDVFRMLRNRATQLKNC